jgi:hypothetical protein
LLRAPALVIKLGELTKLNDQHILLVIVQLTKLDDQCMVINLGDLTKLGEPQVDRYLLQVWVPVPNLARNGHPHSHQEPAGGYLSTFTGTWWRVLGTHQQAPVCHL